jgi:dihydrofolate reductase
MRKVFSGLFASIDGVVESPNEWQPAFDEQMGVALGAMLDGQDAILLGRNTFTQWAQYWPTSTDEPFAGFVNKTQKYVASTTLTSVDHWANSTLIKGSVVNFIRELREQDGGKIGVSGSPTLVKSLIDAGVLDELTLVISPVVAGGGRKRLFPADSPPSTFELVEATSTSTGAIIATYRPTVSGE